MAVTVDVRGLRELERALGEIEKRATQKTVVRNALKKSAEPTAQLMRQMAAGTWDGKISGNIIVGTKIKNEAGRAAYAASMRETGGNKVAAVQAMRGARRAAKGTLPPVLMYVGPGERSWRAHWVEFGISPHTNAGIYAGTRHPGVRPNPFIRPAWDATQNVALDMIAGEMWTQIQRAAARQARRKAKANG